MLPCGIQEYVLQSVSILSYRYSLREVDAERLRIGKFSTRGSFSPRRTYRQSQCSEILHMPVDRQETPRYRLGRSYGPDMAIQHNGRAPIRTCADS